MIVKFNNYVFGGADNIKKDQGLLDEQCVRAAVFDVRKFDHALYDQFFSNRYQTFKKPHSISFWINIYKIIQRVSISAVQ